MSDTPDSPQKNKDKNQGPVLRDHVYDGIQEFDQKLPNWWLFTFYIAIVAFVVFWIGYYGTSWFKSDHIRIQEQLQAINDKKAAELKKLLDTLDDSVLIQWSQNPSIVADGEKIFANNCVTCHGASLNGKDENGGSLSGLNLVDAEWKYGSKPMNLFKLISEGTPAADPGTNGAKMQSWQGPLGGEGVAKAVAYILSKQAATPGAN